jgi:hypothetical protein
VTNTYAKYDDEGNFVGLTSSSRPITKSRWSLFRTDLSQDELKTSRLLDGELVFSEKFANPEQVLDRENTILLMKEKRNAMLAASDWTQVADAPVDREAWAVYRQALRDVPKQAGFPESIIWPTPPE